jgi:hypothetical protein
MISSRKEARPLDLKLVSDALGEELVAGCPAQPAEFSSIAIGANPAAPSGPAPVQPHDLKASFGGYDGPCYVALGATSVAIFAYNPGAFAFAPGRLLASHDLDDLAACEFWPSRLGASRLAIVSASGVRYELTVALAHRGTALRIAEAIEAHLRSNAA